MKFYYKTLTPEGVKKDGIIDTADERAAATYLRRQGLIVIKITESTDNGLVHFMQRKNHFSNNDLVFFTRQLSSMISSGLTLMQALDVMKRQIQKPAVQEVISGIITDIEEGNTFSKSLSRYPDIFSPIYISIVEAAETSGLMDKVLSRLSDNLEKSQRLKSLIKSTLMYPLIVVLLMTIVIVIMMIYVIPNLKTLYDSLHTTLPLPTQILIGVSTFMSRYTLFLVVIIGIGILLFRRWYKTPTGKSIVDTLVLKLPLFGGLIQKSIITELSRTFGLLVGTGTLVVGSLRETANVVGNSNYHNALLIVSEKVEKGVTVGTALEGSPLFPTMLVEMVKIGEKTGKMDESLLRVSEYYERETEQLVKGLTTALEPIILIVLGVGVAFLLISVITPIYKLTNSF